MIPRRRIFAAGLLGALLFLFPLRVALAMADTPLSATFVGGFVWGGRAVGAQVAGLPLGDLRIGLNPLYLFLGRVRLNVEGAVNGALVTGLGGTGADIEAMNLQLTRAIGPVTLVQLEMSGARLRFRGGSCAEAEGRVTATLVANGLPVEEVSQV